MAGTGEKRGTAQGHVRAFDGLRVSCALMVLVMHLASRCGLMVGNHGEKGPLYDVLTHFEITVDLFFVISGFVLYRPWAMAALDGRPRPSVATYYRRRSLRIFPAYWLLLLFTVLCYERDLPRDGWRLLRVITLQHSFDVNDLASQSAPQAAFGPTWSLAVEIQFYFLLPLLALALHPLLTARSRSRFGPAPAMALLGVLPALSVAWTVWAQQVQLGTGWSMRLMSLPAHVGYFALGMMLSVLAVRARPDAGAGAAGAGTAGPGPVVRLVRRRPWACWALGAVVFAALPLTPMSPEWGAWPTMGQSLAQALVYLVSACAVCAPLMLAPESGPARLMSRPLMSRITRLSYGIYLWHMFVIQFVVQTLLEREFGTFGTGAFLLLLPLTAALTVALAAVSYFLVQKPLLARFPARRPSGDGEPAVRETAPPESAETIAPPAPAPPAPAPPAPAPAPPAPGPVRDAAAPPESVGSA